VNSTGETDSKRIGTQKKVRRRYKLSLSFLGFSFGGKKATFWLGSRMASLGKLLAEQTAAKEKAVAQKAAEKEKAAAKQTAAKEKAAAKNAEAATKKSSKRRKTQDQEADAIDAATEAQLRRIANGEFSLTP